ncbi:transketolase [Thalassobaculum sp.]|uniref:transketolase n=1 Tax=Thalassobaculum sp. TaxID=2022740 RepID=UPI0032F04373
MTVHSMAQPGHNRFDVGESRRRCMRYRRRILDISQKVGALHIAPAFSCLEISDACYHGLMRPAPAGADKSPDTFLMSKGHGCMAQYVILEDIGVLPTSDLDAYCTPDGILGAHPDYGNPGIEASTGSLGHGLSMAVGMAVAERNIAGKGSAPGMVYCVLSDGELQEGSTWEAILMGSTLGLTNLVAVVDNNDFQSLGRTSETHPSFYPLVEKLEAFGWESVEVNGHDAGAVYEAVAARKGDRPFFLVAKTVKGRGVSYMESVPIWHYRAPNPDEYRQALDELKEIAS